ncbi:unnamed protein product [Gongylonema pulchrum]|uniref:Uncharacterized protein n=1 Tax=Gongylonema pulchrum TaxID=637853 RepID=A0A183E882_9BILA|nr:unnamed protein product [Gongylonema pulchrum]
MVYQIESILVMTYEWHPNAAATAIVQTNVIYRTVREFTKKKRRLDCVGEPHKKRNNFCSSQPIPAIERRGSETSFRPSTTKTPFKM